MGKHLKLESVKEGSCVARAMEDVKSLLGTQEMARFLYHNLDHALGVAKVAKRLGEKEKLPPADIENLELAGLYHDVGYKLRYKNNEALGAAIARGFLREMGYPDWIVDEIETLILSTRMPPEPEGTRQQILCAADHFNASGPSLFEKGELLRREIEAEEGCKIPALDWYIRQRDYLSGLLDNEAFMEAARRFGMEDGIRLNLRKLNTLIEDIALDNLPRYTPLTDTVFGELSPDKRP
ncbi:MAG: HD domain-containing protein [Candidatus Micrarchaeota archaeon]|nr:HD domain-containing protein [Candidatus Micrarchaeota archaeon]